MSPHILVPSRLFSPKFSAYLCRSHPLNPFCHGDHFCHLSFNLFCLYPVLAQLKRLSYTEYSGCRCTVDLYSVVMMALILFSLLKILVQLLDVTVLQNYPFTSRSHFWEVMVSSQPITLYVKIELFFLCAFVCTECLFFPPIIASITRSFSMHHSWFSS